ncbi:alpha-D-ribose 1-methylphosphonate 5-triphosphate diphosphatase [Alkalihalobacillus sp. BA299]|uniref:alpha-D-ribose 1-methylphosphonate 5-triphosphate diphosphatase n=1 Tax=Alkalihalobacillus sp. BA299 TaxID=2815938 RepID=UPI001ADCB885|nr:alpha-D-ribose 1-methylphosphonate 5-triphosphate diphosphatase [Alkalihalobacillus sp. BA299]
MTKRMKIYNGKIVLPHRVIDNGTILIEGETIVGIEEGTPLSIHSEDIDAAGKWVVPGFVDSHSDAIEIELEPRPSSRFPLEVSFYELEKKLVGQGITTIYHSLSLMEDNAKKWTRRNATVLSVIKDIKRLAKGQHLIRHKTHLRYEITNLTALNKVEELLKSSDIDQLSFMDHTPGQGQFRDIEVHKKLLMQHRHYSEEEAAAFIEEAKALETLGDDEIKLLALLADDHGVPIASHDDDTVEKLEVIQEWKATISEFPIELEVAKKAKDMNLYVVMGAPNALLGKSHSNNLSAMEAIEHGLVDIFCSDYYPSSLLYTVFKLYHGGMNMYEAINMVTFNPAKALKIDKEVGSIEVGKKADILIIGEEGQRPILETVFVNGQAVCQMNFQMKTQVSEVY